jgi:S-adenosylmethionine hydrolase
MTPRVITFLSDYGLTDDFVGVCHGVIVRICPQARIIDLGHGVRRHDVRAGALMLSGALPFLPAGVHLGVVDPGVGGQRRAVALRLADGRLLVGPDNGLLMPAAERGGGVVEAVDIGESPLRLKPVSATFHGRDIFAPVAAHLAAGSPLAGAGAQCDPSRLATLTLPAARHEHGELIAQAMYVDGFGNVALNITPDQLSASGLRLGGRVRLIDASGEPHLGRYMRTFSEVEPGELVVYEDAYRRLAVAVSRGSAQALLRLGVDDELRVGPG